MPLRAIKMSEYAYLMREWINIFCEWSGIAAHKIILAGIVPDVKMDDPGLFQTNHIRQSSAQNFIFEF